MPGPGRPNILAGNQGSFTIVMALSLTLILTLILSVLDFGFFVREKNRYQAAAEAAALAAVDTICYSTPEDLETLIMEILQQFNLDIPDESVDIELGFYDAYNEYGDPLGRYQDFASTAEGPLPEGQPTNAVMITIGFDTAVKSLTGFTEEKEIVGAAVAYTPKISMVAGEDIDFEASDKTSLSNGSIYAKKTISLRGDNLDRTENNIRITTSDTGKINQYTARRPGNWHSRPILKPSPALPEGSLVNNHMISVSDLIKRLKKRTTKTFSLSQGGSEFYHRQKKTGGSGNLCLFDFTRSHEDHEIIFIDLPDTDTAYLTPYYPCHKKPFGIPAEFCTPCAPGSTKYCNSKPPYGKTMSNMTIIATCNVIIPVYRNSSNSIITLGGAGFDRLNIISQGSIEFSTQNNELAGVNFVCKNNFTIKFTNQGLYTPPLENCIRVISESGSIIFGENYKNASKQYDFNLSAGLHCPPMFPSVLGRFYNAE